VNALINANLQVEVKAIGANKQRAMKLLTLFLDSSVPTI